MNPEGESSVTFNGINLGVASDVDIAFGESSVTFNGINLGVASDVDIAFGDNVMLGLAKMKGVPPINLLRSPEACAMIEAIARKPWDQSVWGIAHDYFMEQGQEDVLASLAKLQVVAATLPRDNRTKTRQALKTWKRWLKLAFIYEEDAIPF